MDQLPRLGKREVICLLLFTCNYVVSVRRAFIVLWVLGIGYVILLWHSLSLPYNYFALEGSTFVLIASVPSHCLYFTFSHCSLKVLPHCGIMHVQDPKTLN